MLDFIFELIIDLIFEGSYEISKNRKISKWIRYPLIVFIVLTFTIIILAIMYLGIKFMEQNTFVGALIIGIDVFFIIVSINKFRKIYLSNYEGD